MNGLILRWRQCDVGRRDYVPLALASLSAALLFAGGMLYIAFRSRTLVMFEWFSWLGIGPEIARIRSQLYPLKPGVSTWVYLSLPTTLWMLSGVAMLACVWRGAPGWRGRLWAVAFISVSLSSELLQFSGVIPGTFDPIDVAMMLAGVPAIVLWNRICGLPKERT